MFGDAPEWTFWALVGLLAFLMILPGLNRRPEGDRKGYGRR
jgi:hypothetical protein